ncbi:MAG: hypothetical protein AAFR37_14575 [Cyanobacteria bacterium J06628_3]
MKLFWQLIKTVILASSVFTINYSAIAQEESKEPQPPKELERLEYLQGTWRCQQPAAPAPANSIFIWNVRRDLNNFWYVGKAQETRSPNNAKPISSQEFIGYNGASEKLIRSTVVGDGNSYNMTATDWKDGKLIWEGILFRRGASTPLRQEIVQNSQDKFTATYFITDEENKWKPAVNETCNRIK